MGEDKGGQTPEQIAIAVAEEKRRRLAEAATTIGVIVKKDPNMRPEEVKTWRDTANASLNSLAPGQGATATPEAIQRITGLLENDLQAPGPAQVKKLIKKIEDK